MTDTIFAVSSGAPPAAIAVMRVSGPAARTVAERLAGSVPEPRRAILRRLHDAAGEVLDRALVLWFSAPATATGDDLLELHLHGGRAVVAAVERAIAAVPGTRRAEAGEFTRRALLAGRIDLAQATGLADLLEAETESQRRAAMAMSEGLFSRDVRAWLDQLSRVRAGLEAAIDYDDEGDVTPERATYREELAVLTDALTQASARPSSERVREGWRVVLAGPPNVGKSSLFNALIDRDAAIVSPIAGTTRDRIEARVLRHGIAYTLVDTAGLAEQTDDLIEREGIRRTSVEVDASDLVLWLDDRPPPPGIPHALWLHARSDLSGRGGEGPWDRTVSVQDVASIDALWVRIAEVLSDVMGTTETYLLQEAQRATILAATLELEEAQVASDALIVAEHLRRSAALLGRLLGVDEVESMLDALFARFCVGK